MKILDLLGGHDHLVKTIGAKNFGQAGLVVTFRFKGSAKANTIEIVETDKTLHVFFWIVPSREGRDIHKVLEQQHTNPEDLKTLFETTTGLKL